MAPGLSADGRRWLSRANGIIQSLHALDELGGIVETTRQPPAMFLIMQHDTLTDQRIDPGGGNLVTHGKTSENRCARRPHSSSSAPA
jgi:hypothetical protein